MTGLWFEDLRVGQVFTSPAHRMEAARIASYAAEFDFQAQHQSEERARESLFGRLSASGWHTAAVTMRLMLESGLSAFDGRMLGAGIEGIEWPAPVHPGDELRAVSEVVALRPLRSRGDLGLMRLRTVTLNQDDRPVQVMTGKIMVARRDRDAPATS